MKQRATLDEQINTLVSHGVTFDLMDEEKARRFLSNNSYFFCTTIPDRKSVV